MHRILVGITFALTLSASANADAIKSVESRADVRGSIVFRTYCVLCHGERGEGDGRAARNYNPPPANLVKSTASDAYKELIIRGGGPAVGRSPFMPPWGKELSDEQVRDVIAYLRAIGASNLNNASAK